MSPHSRPGLAGRKTPWHQFDSSALNCRKDHQVTTVLRHVFQTCGCGLLQASQNLQSGHPLLKSVKCRAVLIEIAEERQNILFDSPSDATLETGRFRFYLKR